MSRDDLSPTSKKEIDASADDLYSVRVKAGRRTYFVDVKSTRSGEDYFLTISESKRERDRFHKSTLYLYKEDFGKFLSALHEAIEHIQVERLPDYEFPDMPDRLERR